MKFWGLAIAAFGVAAASLQSSPSSPEYVLFLSGNAQGYLSPCGCSAPMIGGTKRRATAIKKLGVEGRTLLLENGGLVKGAGRQDEIKLETFAQLHAGSHGAILNLSPSEAALGPGAVMSMIRLSNERLLSASVEESSELQVKPFRVEGPFLIGGLSTRSQELGSLLNLAPVGLDTATRNLVEQTTRQRKNLVIVLDGSREDAIELARKFPSIMLIHYRSFGSPPAKSERIGNVLLASPGDGGRHLIRLVWKRDRFNSYVTVELDPGYSDDPEASAAYKTYLGRIDEENLLDNWARSETGKFVGTEACGKCHTESHKVWKGSKHAAALHTLEKEGHQRDPDCVECHVVGLASIYGFRSRQETPDLADVGCESCHGPGEAHSAEPTEVKMGAVGEKSCMPCHRVENSPKFNFADYWPKIQHK